MEEFETIVITFEDGEEAEATSCTLKSFYPSSASNLGIAPYVIPITNDDIFVVGGDIHMTRYNFSTGKITDSFANKSALTPQGFEINGGEVIALGSDMLQKPDKTSKQKYVSFTLNSKISKNSNISLKDSKNNEIISLKNTIFNFILLNVINNIK